MQLILPCAGFEASYRSYITELGDELLGVSNLRHYLNQQIRHAGGHIGLGLRPSQRGRGLGTWLLQLTLAEAAQRGIAPVHVHCYRDNLPSVRMILANGGRLESELALDDGHIVQRYLVGSPLDPG